MEARVGDVVMQRVVIRSSPFHDRGDRVVMLRVAFEFSGLRPVTDCPTIYGGGCGILLSAGAKGTATFRTRPRKVAVPLAECGRGAFDPHHEWWGKRWGDISAGSIASAPALYGMLVHIDIAPVALNPQPAFGRSEIAPPFMVGLQDPPQAPLAQSGRGAFDPHHEWWGNRDI
jgi:hypothetical protein